MKITLKVTKTTLAVFAIVMFSAGLVMISRAFTKGDLMVATDSSNLTRLSVGTDGQFLKADSTATSGVSWASVPAAVAKYEISDGSVKALWHLDTLNDSAGSANFTPSGSPTQVTGKFRSLTYHFSSGSSQYLKVTSVPISGTSTLTIHGWFKPDSNSNKGRIVMVGRDGINGYGISQGATNDSTNGDNFLHVNDGIAWHQSGGTWGNTAWHMFDAVLRSGTWYYYLDGALTSTQVAETPNAPTQNTTIGAAYDTAAGEFLSGAVEDAALINKALTTSTISDLWNGGSGREICVSVGCNN